MKKIISLVTALILALCLGVPALALEQSECFYVTDETGVLSQDTVDHVLELNYTLEERCGGAQIVVVFVDYFGDAYADEYAVSLFNSWSLSPRAMLLVVSPVEKRGGMTVGTDIKTAFDEDDINDYLEDYFWDEFDDGNYDEAVTELADELYDWFMDRYDMGADPLPESGSSGGGTAALAGVGVLGVVLGFIMRNILIILLFVLIIVLIIWSDRRRYRGYYRSIGQPIPRYYPWYIFSSRPYRRYRAPRPPRRPPPPPPPPHGGGGYPPPRSGGPGPGSSSPRTGSPRPRSSSPRPPRPSGGSRPSGGFRPSGGGRSGGSFGGRR